MAERTVRMGSMSYIDPEGRHRRADCGVVVQVHPDHVARFDRLNVLACETAHVVESDSAEADTEPKRRTRARKPAGEQ